MTGVIFASKRQKFFFMRKLSSGEKSYIFLTFQNLIKIHEDFFYISHEDDHITHTAPRSAIDAFLVRLPDLVSRLCGDESEGWHSSRHFSRVFVHFEAFYRLSSRRLCALSFHLPAVPAIRFEL